jgi:hypothetical protein
MRRKRTLGVIASANGEGGGASPRHAISPRSPGSQGTFDSTMDINSAFTGNASTAVGGTTSFVGSVIGHDDPTLLHANIRECYSSGINDSATLSSIFTEAASDEIRDSSHVSRSGVSVRSISDAGILERELIELDKAQEQWKLRHEEEQELRFSHHTRSEEMDRAGEFYVEEVGTIHRASPRPRVLSLQQQIIFEGDEHNEESSREPSEAGVLPQDQQNATLLGNMNKREFLTTSVVAGGCATAVGAAMASGSTDSSVEDSLPSDLVYEYPSTEESTSRGEQPENAPEETHQYVEAPCNATIRKEAPRNATIRKEPDVEEREVEVHEVQTGLYDLSFNNTSFGTELQLWQGGTPLSAERTEPPSVQQRKGFKSWIPVYDDSERTRRLKSQTVLADRKDVDDSEVDQEDERRKRRPKICLLNICLILLVAAAITCSILFALAFRSRGEETDVRGDAVVIGPTTPPSLRPTDEKPTFNLIPPNMIPPEATAPSNVLTSAPEEISSGEPSSGSTPSSGGSDSPTTGEYIDSNGDSSGLVSTSSPTSSSTWTQSNVSSSPSLSSASENSSMPSAYEGEDIDGRLSISSSPTISVPSLPQKGPAEGMLVAISGDAIYDPETPQYAAFDWLQHGDPANLDLDILPDQTLRQRYVAVLFYFSLHGDSWVDNHRFLEESDVCEWNNHSPSSMMGIVCGSADTSDDSSATKDGIITAIVLSE